MPSGMEINSSAIPSPMGERGAYKFNPPAVLGRNGRGTVIAAPAASLEWKFSFLTVTEMAYWMTTLLAGGASAEFTQAKFFNHAGTLTTYTHCTVLRPTFDQFVGGAFENVTIQIDQIY